MPNCIYVNISKIFKRDNISCMYVHTYKVARESVIMRLKLDSHIFENTNLGRRSFRNQLPMTRSQPGRNAMGQPCSHKQADLRHLPEIPKLRIHETAPCRYLKSSFKDSLPLQCMYQVL
jgi:hypothetical protein